MRLTLEIIESYGFEKEVKRVDWDDVENTYTLKNGITLSCLSICGNEPVNCDTLYGFDELLEVETKEELERLMAKTMKEVCEELEKKYSHFDKEEYI